jgi:hypothetical protein
MENQEQENKSGAKSALFIGLIVSLAAINGFMFYNWNNQKKMNENLEKEIAFKDSINKSLEGDKTQNLSKIGELESTNLAKDSLITLREGEIDQAKARLAELGRKQKLTAGELGEAKSLIRSLRAAEVKYKLAIDSFLTINEGLITEKEKLIAENTGLKTDLQAEKQAVASLEGEKTDLISKGQVLKVSNVQFMGFQKKNSGDKATDKANKIDRFDVSFDVLDNPIAKNEAKTAYLRIIDPMGKVLTNPADAAGSVSGNVCSKKVGFNYEKNGSTVKTSFVPVGKLEEGRYTIEVYIDSQLAGKGSDNLRKSFL